MKQLKNFFTVKWYAMLSALLGLLGYAACGDKDEYGPDLYGQPYAKFKVDGAVLNEDNEPVENVAVYVKRQYNDTTYTDKDGKFLIEDNDFIPFSDSVVIMAVDKSGIYEPDSVKLQPKFSGGSDWFVGSYETTQNFTLKKKSTESETDTDNTDGHISEE